MKRTITILTSALVLAACQPEKGPMVNTGSDSAASDSGADPTGDSDSSTGGGGDPSGDPSGDPPATSTATTTGADPTEGSSSSTTCSFVCDTTDGNETEGPQCDNWTQDCPDGQKCSAYADDGGSSWNNLKCVMVGQNPGLPGDPCTVEGNGVSGVDSCDLAAMCWDIDPDTGQGTCVALCTGSPDAPSCSDPNTTCVIANDGVLNLCLPKCDPLLQDCGGDDLCLPNPNDPNGFVCVLDASGETGVAFDPCEYGNACDKGLVCQDPAFATECDPQAKGCCLPYCDTTAPECPGNGLECIPWYEAGTAPPGYDNLGLCGIPG